MTRFTETSYAPINRSAYRLAAEATDAYEASAGQGRPLHQRSPPPTRWSSPRTPPRRSTWSIQSWGGANLRPGDVVVLTELEHHANIVPWHILAQPSAASSCAGSRSTTDGQLDLSGLDGLLDGAKVLSFSGDEQRARHADPGRRAVRRRPRRRCPGHRRRLPVRAAQRHRRAGLGRRLRRVLQPQDVRAVGHRRAVGPRRAARRHAAVPRRRQHDRRRPPRRLHAGAGAGEVRGRHAADHRGDRLRRGGRLSRRRSGWTPCTATSWSSRAYALEHAQRALRRRHHPARPARARTTAAACSASRSATSTPTTSARCSTSRTSACAPATTAPSR